MKERIFSAAAKLGGLIGRKDHTEEILALERSLSRAVRLLELKKNQNWTIIPEVLNDFWISISRDFTAKGLTDAELHRLNHRAEFLKEIYDELEAIIKQGEYAADRLNKLKERKSNG